MPCNVILSRWGLSEGPSRDSFEAVDQSLFWPTPPLRYREIGGRKQQGVGLPWRIATNAGSMWLAEDVTLPGGLIGKGHFPVSALIR